VKNSDEKRQQLPLITGTGEPPPNRSGSRTGKPKTRGGKNHFFTGVEGKRKKRKGRRGKRKVQSNARPRVIARREAQGFHRAN